MVLWLGSGVIMRPDLDINAVILVGGKSRRFESDKAAVQLKNGTFVVEPELTEEWKPVEDEE